jgi:thioredoxin
MPRKFGRRELQRISDQTESINMKVKNTNIVEIGGTDFKSEVIESKRAVLVAFLAPWSRPCGMILPVLDGVSVAGAGSVKVVRINADDNPGLGMVYNIHSIPTLLCFVDGEERTRIVGTASKEAILATLKPFIGTI